MKYRYVETKFADRLQMPQYGRGRGPQAVSWQLALKPFRNAPK